MIKLICKRVTFYSPNDEGAFFEWISKIRGIKKWEGVRDEIHIYLPKSTISNKCLRELMSLFYRYNVDRRQLQPLLNDKNRQWYVNDKPSGHHNVYPISPTK
jgi:hypothetical protein